MGLFSTRLGFLANSWKRPSHSNLGAPDLSSHIRLLYSLYNFLVLHEVPATASKGPADSQAGSPEDTERRNAPPLSCRSCTCIQCHNTLHTTLSPRSRPTAPINHTAPRSHTSPGRSDLRDNSRPKGGYPWQRQRNSPRANIIIRRSLRGSTHQKPVSRRSNGIPCRGRTGTYADRILHSIGQPTQRVKGRTIRILPNLGKPWICSRLFCGRISLYFGPNNCVLRNIGPVQRADSTRNPGFFAEKVGQLPRSQIRKRKYRMIARFKVFHVSVCILPLLSIDSVDDSLCQRNGSRIWETFFNH